MRAKNQQRAESTNARMQSEVTMGSQFVEDTEGRSLGGKSDRALHHLDSRNLPKEVNPPERGLVNNNNDCFVIAGVQMLQLLPIRHIKPLNVSKSLTTVARILTGVIRSLRTKGAAISVTSLRQACAAHDADMVPASGQHCAVNALHVLLAAFGYDDTHANFSRPELETIGVLSSVVTESSCLLGVLRRDIKSCQHCGEYLETAFIERITLLGATVETLTLEARMRQLEAPNDKHECGECGKPTTRRTTIHEASEFVLLRTYPIIREDNKSSDGQNSVDFYQSGTAITPVTIAGHVYEPVAAILHHPDATARGQSGHYTVHMKFGDRKFASADDTAVDHTNVPFPMNACLVLCRRATIALPNGDVQPNVDAQPSGDEEGVDEVGGSSHVSLGRGGEGNATGDGDVEGNPGPHPEPTPRPRRQPQPQPPPPPIELENHAPALPFRADPGAVDETLLLPAYIRLHGSTPPEPLTARPVCTCSKPPGRQGRHRAGCPCSSSTSTRSGIPLAEGDLDGTPRREAPPARARQMSHIAFDSQPEAISVGAYSTPSRTQLPFEPPIPLQDLLRLRSVPVDTIPRQARPIVASALAQALSAHLHTRWFEVLAFGKLVLHRPPAGQCVAEVLVRRAKDFSDRNWGVLIDGLREADRRDGARVKTRVEFTESLGPGKASPYEAPDECRAESLTAKNSIRRVRQGCVSKGLAALSARTQEVLEAMREKHPAAEAHLAISDAQKALLQRTPALQEASHHDVMRCLRQFPPASSAGPSGLSPGHLLVLANHPGSPVRTTLGPVVTAIINGTVPEAYRRFVYGAKLVPLLKADKALRPIACSEALRRVGAKILATRLAKKFREVLTPHGQIGVAVSSGLEALASWTRRSALLIAGWT